MDIDRIYDRLNRISEKSKEYDKELKNMITEQAEMDRLDTILDDTLNEELNEGLPEEHYLQSKKDVIELYKLFIFYGMLEHCINIIKINNIYIYK